LSVLSRAGGTETFSLPVELLLAKDFSLKLPFLFSFPPPISFSFFPGDGLLVIYKTSFLTDLSFLETSTFLSSYGLIL
jgi:hypothetical protein